MPERYGPWSTVYSRFNGWAKAGVFQGLMEALIAEAAARGQVGLELVSVDSTIVRAHQESAGLAVAGETLDALEQALTEEKGAPLEEQPPVLRVMRRRSQQVEKENRRAAGLRRALRTQARIVPSHGGAAGPARPLPGSADPEAG